MRLRLLGRLEVLLVRLLNHRQGDAHVLGEVRAAAVVLHDLKQKAEKRSQSKRSRAQRGSGEL